MAAAFSKGHGRRLSELLEEQQEPFLLRPTRPTWMMSLCHCGFKKSNGSGSGTCLASKNLLRRITRHESVRRFLKSERAGTHGNSRKVGIGILGCFTANEPKIRIFSFRRLTVAEVPEDAEDSYEEEGHWKPLEESSRQLSPVSVLELVSDDSSSPTRNHSLEDEKPSTSESSPSFEDLFSFNPHYSANSDKKDWDCEDKLLEEQISSWEKIARDIAKVPLLVKSDIVSTQDKWSQLKNELRDVGNEIEALIFDEIRGETVCDMLCSCCKFKEC